MKMYVPLIVEDPSEPPVQISVNLNLILSKDLILERSLM